MLRSPWTGNTPRNRLSLPRALLIVFVVLAVPALLHAQDSEDGELDRFYEEAFGVPAEPLARNVHVGIHGRRYGEVRAFVTPAGRLVSMREQGLRSLLEGALREEAFADVAAALSESEDGETGEDGYIDVTALETLDIGVNYNRRSRMVDLSVPGPMLQARTLSIRERGVGPELPEDTPRVGVAPLSGGLGIGAGYRVSDIGRESSGDPDEDAAGLRHTAELTGTPFISAADWTLDTELDWRIAGTDTVEQRFRVSRARARRLWEPPGILLTIGDLSPDRDVFQSGQRLQGISISRRGATRGQTSDPLSQFSLDTASDIEVVVNDQVVFERTLPPGLYELSDIPLSRGLNEVTVRFPESERENINLWLPYDSELLEAGEQEYFHGFGLPAVLLDPERPVEGEVLRTTSLHRYGFTQDLTGSAGAQLSPEAGQVSGGVNRATGIGNLGAATALSLNENREPGFGLQGTYGLFLNTLSFRPSFRLTVGWFGPALADPDRTAGRGGMLLQASAAYSQALPLSMTGVVRSEVRYEPVADETAYRASLGLSSSRIRNTRVSARLEYQGGDGQSVDGLSGYIGVRISPTPRVSGSYRQSVTSPDASLGVSARGRSDGVGRYQGSVDADYNMAEPGRVERVGARTSLSGRRGALGLSGSVNTSEGTGSTGSVRASARSGLVFAGDAVAIEPPPADGSFSIIRLDPDGEFDRIEVSAAGRGSTTVNPGLFGSVVVPGEDAYEPIPVRFSRAGLPLGYEISPDLVAAETGLRTGTVVEPQLRGIVFARGTLEDGEGEPVSLAALTLEPVAEEEAGDVAGEEDAVGEEDVADEAGGDAGAGEEDVADEAAGDAGAGLQEEAGTRKTAGELLFTNRDGRFEARGLRAGQTYELRASAVDRKRARFTIPEGHAGRLDLGSVTLEQVEEE